MSRLIWIEYFLHVYQMNNSDNPHGHLHYTY